MSVKTSEYYGGADLTHTDERWKKDEILAAKIKKFLSLDSGNGSQRSFRSSRQTRPKHDWPTLYDSLHKPTLYDTGRGTSLETESGSSDPHVKDSGNDTGLSSSSNQTLNNVDEVLSKRQSKVDRFKNGTLSNPTPHPLSQQFTFLLPEPNIYLF
ncbi:hypothetical protein Btru_009557 [Bulinus truncatus]|nr:hypothetical protein Btru_009557 [Bulinus truncatus]